MPNLRYSSNPLANEKIPQAGNQPKTSKKTSLSLKSEGEIPRIFQKVRYNDVELAEFKELILCKLGAAQGEYGQLKAAITHAASNGTEDTSPVFKVLEEGASALSKEEQGQLAERQLKFIRSLEAALIRIENKSYGICRETGKLINKDRLLIVPHATLSVEGKEIEEQRKKIQCPISRRG
ncbi:MAG TPA: TraR/DksA C4-type zinc finger protein [Candidatus Humimicrobiaceae bacterium]